MAEAMTPFTLFHVLLSLIGIGSGFIVIFGFLTGNRMPGWNALFLVTTVATSVTGFLFPFHKLLPSHILGIMSLVLLVVALYALYARKLEGGWRRTYVITAVLAQYFNCFVLVAQLFMKVPALKALAPTQSEPPFKIAQLVLLLVFVFLGVLSARNFSLKQTGTA